MRRVLAALISAVLLLTAGALHAQFFWRHGIQGPQALVTLGPTIVTPSTFNAVAGNANSLVGVLSTTNSQNPAYSIVTPGGCTTNCADNAKFAISGHNLNIGASDVTTATTYNITVRETDAGAGPWVNNPFDQHLVITGAAGVLTGVTVNCDPGCGFTPGSTSAIGTATATTSPPNIFTGTWSFRTLQLTFAPTSPSVPSNTSVGTVVAAIQATWSDGTPFTGTLGFGPPNNNDGGVFAISGNNLVVNSSLAGDANTTQNVTITATDPSTCTNPGTNFSINPSASSGVITAAASAPAGSFVVCPDATQAGLAGSPLDKPITITGSSSGGGIACGVGPNFTGTIPAPARVDGLTACLANFDFTYTSPFTNGGNTYQWSNFNSWFNCPGSYAPANPLWWAQGYLTGNIAPCNAYTLVNDSADNNTQALSIHWDTTYWTDANGIRSTYMESAGNGGATYPTGTYFPLGGSYVEIKTRLTGVYSCSGNTGNNGQCGLSDVFSWTPAAISPNALEWDHLETGNDGGWNGGGILDYNNGGSGRCGSNVGGCGINSSYNHFPGLTSYHIFAAEIHIDGSANVYLCNYLDNSSTNYSCSGNLGAISSQVVNFRNWLKMGSGPQNTPDNTDGSFDMRVEWIHVFSCPSWAAGQCLSTGPASH